MIKENSKAQLSDAQFEIAKSYGFASWPKLKAFVEKRELELRENKSQLRRAKMNLRNGRMCILFDDEGRENEGDFVASAESISSEVINQMTKIGRGTLCLALEAEQANKLNLSLINSDRKDHAEPAFLAPIDAVEGVTTGVSAFDRAQTIRVAVSDNVNPNMVKSPGHVFPLLAVKGGIKERCGHTEGSIELMKLAGLKPSAVICEILNEDGSMARLPDLKILAKELGVAILKMSDL